VSFSRAVLDRHGALLRLSLSRDEKYRLRAGLPDFSPLAVQAALLYEDRHFHRHPGVNPAALVRAAWRTYVSGGRRMGGSTLTMQVARLRFGLNTASPWGKLVQIARALQIERHYTKDEILEAYLNLAPYGSNVEGLAAASWVYFRKPARELTLPEALLLAAVPQNPAARNPLALTGAALTRARERLARMWAEADPAREGRGRDRNAASDAARGLPWDTTQGLAQALATAPLAVHGPATLPFLAPHACAELLARTPGNATAEAPAPATIRSTIDLPLQRLTERILSRFIQRAKSQGLDNAAALLLDHRTMDILALAGSADFSDPAIAGQVDATRARRSPGSTLKPFIYALALDQGLIHPLTLLADAPRSFHGYTPENADQHFQGPLPARQALALSRNIPAIVLANRLSRPTFYDFLRRAGVEFASGPEHYGLALVLGGAEVTMRELAGLYAMLPAGGVWRAPRLALDAPRDYNATRALLTPEAAFVTLDMLRDNPLVPRTLFGEDRGARTAVHSKTGTSNGLRDAWTAGVFGRFVLVVWVGHADGHSDPLLVGARVAAPLFMDLAEALAAREPSPTGVSGTMGALGANRPAPGRPPDGLNLVRAKVCADTGDTDTSLCPRTETTWFIPGVSPIRSTGVYREILVDRATGLRDCSFEEGRTERRVFEFWPSDLARIFAQAGVYKPRPPEFRPECRERAASQGRAPDITVPRAGMRYTVSLSREADNEVPLSAVVDADAGAVHWFADNRYLGRAEPGQALAWRPAPGRVTVRAVDDLGRAGSRVVDVELVD
jgi:penicillin-binding protein 1C